MEKKSWEKKEFQELSLYLCVLMRAALSGKKAGEKPESVSWEDVFTLAKNNSVDGLCYLGLSDLLSPPPMELMSRWKRSYDIGLYRQLGFEEERHQIEKMLEVQRISMLPLKGILLAEYYPIPGMRSMADNDILYGFVEEGETGGYRICGKTKEEQAESVRYAQKLLKDLMEKRGYRMETEPGDPSENNHDVFMKEPYYNFEFHRDLLPEWSPQYEYYENPWKRAIRDSEKPYHFRFKPEDEYIFLQIHASKHFEEEGAGFRFLADLYVFLMKKKDSLNWDYIKEELGSLGLLEFEKEMRTLSEAMLGNERQLGDKEKNRICFLLYNMIYGRRDKEGKHKVLLWKKEQNAKSKLEAKWLYALDRIFLPGEMSKKSHPFFYKYWIFKPVLIIWRLLKGIFICPDRLWREIRMLFGVEK